MPSFKTTVLATAVLLAVSSGAAQAQPNSEIKAIKSVVNELQKQLEELKKSNSRSNTPSLEQARIEELSKQVNELRTQLGKQQASAQAVAAAPAAGAEESQESIDARTAASKADIQGMRTDLENYKYDQSRLQERNIPSVTRNTKIGGSLTVRYDNQNPEAPPSAASSGYGPTDPRNRGFAAPAFGLNFAGNLFRDYTEGRNLTYRLALTSQNNASGSSSTVNLTDAYLRYSFQPASGNAEDPLGTLTLGQQIVPFGLEAQALDPEVKAVIGSAGFVNGLGFSTRQTGLVLSGDYEPYVDFTNNYRAPLLSYALGVFNGNGANKADNNNYSDIA
ncbi:MAG: porin, partial [Polaromonas sp.]|nr:porin [Polaromonas sp.]